MPLFRMAEEQRSISSAVAEDEMSQPWVEHNALRSAPVISSPKSIPKNFHDFDLPFLLL